MQATTTEETDELPGQEQGVHGRGQACDRDRFVRRPGRGHQRRGARPGRRDVGGFPGDAVRDQAEQRQARAQAGEIADAAPYGWPVKKGSPLAQSLQAGARAPDRDRQVQGRSPSNWGVEKGMIDKPVINGAIS